MLVALQLHSWRWRLLLLLLLLCSVAGAGASARCRMRWRLALLEKAACCNTTSTSISLAFNPSRVACRHAFRGQIHGKIYAQRGALLFLRAVPDRHARLTDTRKLKGSSRHHLVEGARGFLTSRQQLNLAPRPAAVSLPGSQQ